MLQLNASLIQRFLIDSSQQNRLIQIDRLKQ